MITTINEFRQYNESNESNESVIYNLYMQILNLVDKTQTVEEELLNSIRTIDHRFFNASAGYWENIEYAIEFIYIKKAVKFLNLTQIYDILYDVENEYDDNIWQEWLIQIYSIFLNYLESKNGQYTTIEMLPFNFEQLEIEAKSEYSDYFDDDFEDENEENED